MDKVLLAIDQSTAGTKAVVMDKSGRVLQRDYRVHKQYYPREGWVEQDAEEIFDLTCQAIRTVVAEGAYAPEHIAALAVSVQTGAFVLWNRNTGRTATHIIGWQDNRGGDVVAGLTPRQLAYIKEKTGTDASAYLPAAKLRQVLDADPALRAGAENGDILFGSIDTWMCYKLTGGKTFATDYCNASITQLFDNKALRWDEELLRIFNIPEKMLPEPQNADWDYGVVDVAGLPAVPVTGVMGDSAAALFAQCGFTPGDVKITYGTGASILMNLGDDKDACAEGMTTSVGWRMNGDQVTYVWEGTAMNTGAVIAWLVKNAGMLESASASEDVAAAVPDSGGVYFVPAFSGLGGFYEDTGARACIVGMSTATTKAHIVRAALEATGYLIRDMLESMKKSAKADIPVILVDGGPTANSLLMQFQADMLGVPVLRSELEESSLLGVAYMAGLAVGVYENKEALLALRRPQREFAPAMGEEEREARYQGWQRAIRQTTAK